MATSEATSSPLLMLVTGRVRLKPFVVSHVGGSSTNTSLPDLLGFPVRDWGDPGGNCGADRSVAIHPHHMADREFREFVEAIPPVDFSACRNRFPKIKTRDGVTTFIKNLQVERC
ncbi:hypothetical protein [Phormidesmis priestleyi]